MSCHYLAVIQSQYLSLARRELVFGTALGDSTHVPQPRAQCGSLCPSLPLMSSVIQSCTVTLKDTINVAV